MDEVNIRNVICKNDQKINFYLSITFILLIWLIMVLGEQNSKSFRRSVINNHQPNLISVDNLFRFMIRFQKEPVASHFCNCGYKMHVKITVFHQLFKRLS